jgi:hypothetical protein
MQLTNQPGMNDAMVEDPGKRYLRLSQLPNKESLLRKDASCGFSLLSALSFNDCRLSSTINRIVSCAG